MLLAVEENRAEREALRQQLRQARAVLTPQEIAAASLAVCTRVRSFSAAVVACYAPIAGEVDLLPLASAWLKEGRRLAFPRVTGRRALEFRTISALDELKSDRFAIAAPPLTAPLVPLDQLELVFVPGIAFGRDGHRLGFGHGYYDAALAACPQALRVGIAHSFQLVESIPAHPVDQPVDVVATPSELHHTLARSKRAPKEVLS